MCVCVCVCAHIPIPHAHGLGGSKRAPPRQHAHKQTPSRTRAPSTAREGSTAKRPECQRKHSSQKGSVGPGGAGKFCSCVTIDSVKATVRPCGGKNKRPGTETDRQTDTQTDSTRTHARTRTHRTPHTHTHTHTHTARAHTHRPGQQATRRQERQRSVSENSRHVPRSSTLLPAAPPPALATNAANAWSSLRCAIGNWRRPGDSIQPHPTPSKAPDVFAGASTRVLATQSWTLRSPLTALKGARQEDGHHCRGEDSRTIGSTRRPAAPRDAQPPRHDFYTASTPHGRVRSCCRWLRTRAGTTSRGIPCRHRGGCWTGSGWWAQPAQRANIMSTKPKHPLNARPPHA